MRKVIITCISVLLMLAYSVDAFCKVQRSGAQKNAFKREHPCPANGNNRGRCPGYIIDHIVPLACGGADNPSNMQWQTVQDAKIKDNFELSMCGK